MLVAFEAGLDKKKKLFQGVHKTREKKTKRRERDKEGYR